MARKGAIYKLSTTKNITITDFKCVICQDIIAFNTEDPTTYESSTVIEEFFSMKLTRFVVKHLHDTEEHVNVVIADQDGKYRGHKDAYIEHGTSQILNKIYSSNTEHIIDHKTIDMFIVLDLDQAVVREYINSIRIKTPALAEKIDNFIKETKEIYEIIPADLVYSYAKKNFHLMLVEKNIFICYSFIIDNSQENQKYLETFKYLKPIINGSHSNSPLLKLIYSVLKVTNIDSFSKNDLEYIHKLLSSDVFFSELTINPDYQEKIKNYIDSFQEKFSCSNFVLNSILDKKTTLNDILDDNVNQFRCIIDFVNYLKRRRLFLF